MINGFLYNFKLLERRASDLWRTLNLTVETLHCCALSKNPNIKSWRQTRHEISQWINSITEIIMSFHKLLNMLYLPATNCVRLSINNAKVLGMKLLDIPELFSDISNNSKCTRELSEKIKITSSHTNRATRIFFVTSNVMKSAQKGPHTV